MSKTTKLRPSQGGKMHAPVRGVDVTGDLNRHLSTSAEIIHVLAQKLVVQLNGGTWEQVLAEAKALPSVCDLEKEIAALKGEISGWKKGLDSCGQCGFPSYNGGNLPECDINRQSFVDLSRDPSLDHRSIAVQAAAQGVSINQKQKDKTDEQDN